MLVLAANLTDFGKPMEKMFTEWYKNKGKVITRYEVLAAVKKMMTDAHATDPRLEKSLVDEAIKNAPAFGIRVTQGMHASRDELFFASEDAALQYLADLTSARVLVAKKWSGKVKTKWSPPEKLFTKPAETIANTLSKSSKTLKQAMGRLNFYINRAGKNLSDKDRGRLEHTKELLRKKFEED